MTQNVSFTKNRYAGNTEYFLDYAHFIFWRYPTYTYIKVMLQYPLNAAK